MLNLVNKLDQVPFCPTKTFEEAFPVRRHRWSNHTIEYSLPAGRILDDSTGPFLKLFDSRAYPSHRTRGHVVLPVDEYEPHHLRQKANGESAKASEFMIDKMGEGPFETPLPRWLAWIVG